LLVHSNLKSDDEFALQPHLSDDEIRENYRDHGADLIFMGHIHYHQERVLDDMRIICVGSVGMPVSNDVRARYVLLNVDEENHTLDFRHVAYDVQQEIDALKRVYHTTPDFITQFYRGKYVPAWER